jgi:hypothetical protein
MLRFLEEILLKRVEKDLGQKIYRELEYRR